MQDATQQTTTPRRRMKLGIMPGLSETAYDGRTPRFTDVVAAARMAEQVGFDSFWLADHFLHRPADENAEGQWEVFTFLSALAAVTTRIALGPLVACTSFRNPALLAKMADSLDEIAGGRFILGLGAGWHEPEYTAFGYPFDHRAARFEEALKIIVPLLREGHVDFAGEYYQARDCELRPRGPTRGGPPLWIGAKRPRMLRLVARYADAFNTVWHGRPEAAAAQYAALHAACAQVGRDPASIELTAGTLVRVLGPGEAHPPDAESVIAKNGIVGTAEEVAAGLRGFAATGTQHLVMVFEPENVGGIERLGRVIELLDRDGI